jgi:hypothetical protein
MKTKSIFLSLLLSVSLHAAYSLSSHETCNIPENICPLGQEHYVDSVEYFENASYYTSQGIPYADGEINCKDTGFNIFTANFVDEYEFEFLYNNSARYYYNVTKRRVRCRDIVTEPWDLHPDDPNYSPPPSSDPTDPDTGGSSSETPNNSLEMSNEDFNLASAIAGILSSTLLAFAILKSF